MRIRRPVDDRVYQEDNEVLRIWRDNVGQPQPSTSQRRSPPPLQQAGHRRGSLPEIIWIEPARLPQ